MKVPTEKFCTILTDASFCPHQNVAGWGVWIVCNDERFKRFDTFFEHIKTSQEAEIRAILNGLTLAKRVFQPEHYHVVSDCITAMKMLRENSVWNEQLIKIVGNRKVTFKHVKAHSDNKDKRTFANHWCDFQAKIAMKSLRTDQGELQNG